MCQCNVNPVCGSAARHHDHELKRWRHLEDSDRVTHSKSCRCPKEKKCGHRLRFISKIR